MMTDPDTQTLNHAKRGGAAVVIVTAFLMAWEGFAPVAVHERVDPARVVTYCYGRTNYDDPTVRVGERFTKEQCDKFLAEDMPRYTKPLRSCLRGWDAMGPHRQAAFITAAYNLGSGTVCKSLMAKKLNAGDVRGACDAFMRYVYANGRKLKGLVNRRAAERANCLRED